MALLWYTADTATQKSPGQSGLHILTKKTQPIRNGGVGATGAPGTLLCEQKTYESTGETFYEIHARHHVNTHEEAGGVGGGSSGSGGIILYSYGILNNNVMNFDTLLWR